MAVKGDAMSDDEIKVGMVGWRDLTVGDAEGIRDFYKSVVGWGSSDVDMGEYADFSMTVPDTEEAVAGVCHAKGANADMPPQWLIYIVVADVEVSVARCNELGGEVLVPPKSMGSGLFCVIRDPAGAVCALYQHQ
jgi:predicted enzyme related to lactoylglutathione lyase